MLTQEQAERLSDAIGAAMMRAERKALPPMRSITIAKTEIGYTVIEGETYADGLCFDEMLGQVVELLHPEIGKPRYRMLTAEQWQDWRERMRRRVENAKTF